MKNAKSNVHDFTNNQSKTTPTNLKLWETLSNVSKEYKKDYHVNGQVLTNVSPYEGFRRLTSIFGSCGTGWGYTIGTIREINTVIQVETTLWYKTKYLSSEHDETASITTIGGTQIVQGDQDVLKKAITNGLSKAMSMLGYASEVYLGTDDLPQKTITAEEIKDPNTHQNNSQIDKSQQHFPNSSQHDQQDIDYEQLAEQYSNTVLPKFNNLKYRWQIRDGKVGFYVPKIPNGLWNILTTFGFKSYATQDGKGLVFAVPLSELLNPQGSALGGLKAQNQ